MQQPTMAILRRASNQRQQGTESGQRSQRQRGGEPGSGGSADKRQEEEGSLESMMKRLQITDATFNCKHGQLEEMATSSNTSSDTSTLSSQDM
eukprot:scaffold37396_cov80-Skeletonema_marinoi.AAC.1